MVINNAKDLERAIAECERKKLMHETMFKENFHELTTFVHDTIDQYRPGNLLKSAVKGILGPGDTQSMLLKAAGGLGAGFLAKNLILGKSTSLIGKLAGNALKVGTTNTIMHHTDKIAAWGSAIYNNLFKKEKKITF